jgi:hypothetical protein
MSGAMIGLKLLSVGARIRAGWAAVPPKAKLWVLGIIAALILGFVHQLYAHRQAAKQFHAGYVKAQADDAAKAKKEKAKLDAATIRITQLEKERIHEDVRHTDDLAHAIGVRGPGRAVCAEPPAPASGPIRTNGAALPPMAGLPDQGGQPLIALPFNDTLAFGRQCDVNAATLDGWNRWYRALEKAWPKAGDKQP